VRERDATEERRIRRIVRYGGVLLDLLARSWRVEVRNAEGWRSLHAAGKPQIVAFWHGEILGCAWFLRHQRITTMVSEHSDGEIIARLVARWGIDSVRGSTSRGAGRVLLQMIRLVEDGTGFAITPDGPRGPAGVPQSGALLASVRTGAPIFPIRIKASRAWRMRSWDRFMIPKPFARVTVTLGAPWVAPGTGEGELAEFARRMGTPESGVPGTGA
jgi:lysophospholipid acyltransferase (LPLAT)-like uncharacterized protein